MRSIKVTSNVIAEMCGVSQGTVDRALNNRPGISQKTRERILETAEKLGYRPHLLARSLAKGCTMTIGLVVFDLYNRFFAQLANAIESSARQQGYIVYLTLTDKDGDAEKACIEHLMSRQVDGLILFSVNQGTEFGEYLKNLKIPLVTLGNRIQEEFPFIGIDDYRAMKDAALHIAHKGYERIIYISPPLAYRKKSNIYAQEQRLYGYLDALKESGKGREPITIEGRDYLQKLDSINLKDGGRTAVLCSSDIYALEVLRHLEARGLSVPEDVGLMGFDNIDMLRYVKPSLATVSYPFEELGVKALECVLNQMQGNSYITDRLLAHTIVEGSSL